MSDTQAATAATGDPITQALIAGFEADEASAQVDNLTPEPTTEEPAVEAPAEEPAAEPAEAEPEAETESEEATEEETETKPEAEAEAAADEEVKILTPEEIEAKFARSNTKEGRAYMAQVSAIAQQGQETVAKLGGTEFIEPLAKMSTALQAGQDDPEALNEFFIGITEASGAETLVTILGQALYMGFVKADEWAKNPATADFAAAIKNVVDINVQAKWGVDSDRMAKLVEWEKVGWLDKLDEWVTNNYVPQSELDEMLEINTNPTLKRLAEENQELKRQREKVTPAEKSDQPQAGQESAFDSYIADSITPVLTAAVWKGSPLQDISTDTAAMKETKAFLRTALTQQAVGEFASNPARAKLLADYQRGKSSTAIYKSELAKAINSTVNATRPQTKMAEEILAKLYGKTRAAHVPQPKTDQTPAPLPPTVPQKHEPAEGPKTVNQVQKNLEEAFKAFG